jgi:hypothetical protein
MTVHTRQVLAANCFEGNTANHKTTIEGTVIARRSRSILNQKQIHGSAPPKQTRPAGTILLRKLSSFRKTFLAPLLTSLYYRAVATLVNIGNISHFTDNNQPLPVFLHNYNSTK